MLELITDRTASDVVNRTKKGYYNVEDLSRVTSAMEYLDAELRKAGYESGYDPIVVHPELPLPGDKSTLLLLHGENIADSSVYEIQLQNEGVVVSSEQSKFGGKSLYFNGSSRIKVLSTELIPNTGDFTVDWWEYRNTTELNGGAVISQPFYAGGAYGFLAGFVVYPSYGYYITSKSNSWDLVSESGFGEVQLNTWTHYAIVRHGNSIVCYQNGKQVSANEHTGSILATSNPYIGYYDYSSAPTYFKGYIDELRVSSVARWVSDFTPPTEPYSISEEDLESEIGKYTWLKTDEPNRTQMEQYLSNVQKIRSTLSVFTSTPKTPESMRLLNHTMANDIEKILLDVETVLANMLKTIDIGWALGIAHTGLYGGA